MLFEPIFDSWDVKLKAGSRMIPVTITKEGDRLFFKFGFNKPLMEEIKAFEGSKWHGYEEKNPRKVWSVKDTERNRFQIRFLAHPRTDDPENPYRRYDLPPQPVKSERNLYAHQGELASHGLTRKQCIFAAEMGTGKTLAAITVMEDSLCHDWIWVGPKSALVSVRVEFAKWKAKVIPRFVTYEGLQKLLAEWPEGKKAPHGVIFDECSRCKNPTAKRTQAARYLADNIRKEWADKGYVILMSGTPAPKSPLDWWSICEIACPGFLREGTYEKFKNRLAIIEQRETFAGGGSYPHLLGWRDDERKCKVCGLFKEAETHSGVVDVFSKDPICHMFEPSINEVATLYERMKGLVLVKFKKDCLDLPDKTYKEVICQPTRSLLNAASAIQAKSSTTIQALTLLRELSDGFQYIESVEGKEECPVCHGIRTTKQPDVPDDITLTDSQISEGYYFRTEEDGTVNKHAITFCDASCYTCSATGFVNRIVRTTKQIPCPKEEALKEILDEHDEIGRIVIYGGFTGSIDRVASIVKSQQWSIIRVDGRGWVTDLPIKSSEDMVRAFQERLTDFPRLAFIGHPGSAGMGLTLTASPTIVYYSNDFNAESRIQSEDRIHRPGMDVNRGATIIDLLHLPTDKLVLDNLKKKRVLQDMSMGEMKAQLEKSELVLTAQQVLSRL